MAADDQNILIGQPLEHRFARLDPLLLVRIKISGTLDFGELDRMMQHIARDKTFVSLRRNLYADVARRVSGRGHERDLICELDIWLDKIGEAGVGDRLD